MARSSDLPPPAVPAGTYDEDYYRHGCVGADEWNASEGREMRPIFKVMVGMAGIGSGETLVDIGCGRGEALVAAVEAGAAKAIGIEYSPAAVELGRKTLSTHGVTSQCDLLLADARAIPLPDALADHVTLLDVVEHLTPDELEAALGEAHRLLKPGGQLFIHTMPNRLTYSVTYRLQRLIFPWRWFTWPSDPRNADEHAMHVNEQTLGTLRRAITAAGFADVSARLGSWIREDFLPRPEHARIYRFLARIGPLARFGIADLFATGRRPSATA